MQNDEISVSHRLEPAWSSCRRPAMPATMQAASNTRSTCRARHLRWQHHLVLSIYLPRYFLPAMARSRLGHRLQAGPTAARAQAKATPTHMPSVQSNGIAATGSHQQIGACPVRQMRIVCNEPMVASAIPRFAHRASLPPRSRFHCQEKQPHTQPAAPLFRRTT